jgi:RNA polymerase sigma-70 factor (ECF subfamily)
VDTQTLELISRCRSGDSDAFAALYDLYAGRVVGYFRRSGFSAPDAADLTQETFVRVFKSLHTFDPQRGGFSVWISMIARNVSRRYWSRRKDGEQFDPAMADEMFAAPDNPHETPETREEIDAVRQCVAQLPDELSKIVRLRYVEGRTTRGIAAAAQMPESTVRMRLDQARLEIARCLRAKGVLE